MFENCSYWLCSVRPPTRVQETGELLNKFSWYIILQSSTEVCGHLLSQFKSHKNNPDFSWTPTRVSARVYQREKSPEENFWRKLKHTSCQYTYITLTVVQITKQKNALELLRLFCSQPSGGLQKWRPKLNTLMTGDADLRFYITTVQDGWCKSAFLTRACFPCTIHLIMQYIEPVFK